MMSLLFLFLSLYFAAMLGVSGLAKAEHPEQFAATLRRHRILPHWSMIGISKIVPWLEIVVAILLILNLLPVITSALVFLLFVSFLVIETILVVKKRATECGCYGVVYPQKVDGASIVISIILVSVAALHLWFSTWVEPVNIFWRLPGIILLGGVGCWLSWKIIIRRHARNKRSLIVTPNSNTART
ncbi:MAG: MauE/DoxX family redox-associated membrane protein [Anaerolineae bacterium]